MEATNYSLLVKHAEEAVEAVKDPELRKVAFEKVLDDLLEGGGEEVRKPAKKKSVPTNRKSPAQKQAARRGPQAYVEELIDDGFFKKPKTIAQVKVELVNRGHHIPLTSLSGPLQRLCQKKSLRRQKTNDAGKKHTFGYSEW